MISLPSVAIIPPCVTLAKAAQFRLIMRTFKLS